MRLITLLLLIMGSVTACTFPSSDSAEGISNPDMDVFTGINLSNLSQYQTSYHIEFIGNYTWRYSLITHYDGELTENNLHIEGVSLARNPGDIRLVTDGHTSWMTGPGVDNECILFPNDFDIGYTFLSPDDTFPPEKITPLLAFESEEKKGDILVSIFSANVPEHGDWRELNIVLWLIKGDDYPVQYLIQTKSKDPLFDAGEGFFSGIFSVDSNPGYDIEPVTGCELPFPLPENAEQVVRFPGLYSFEASGTPENMAVFYQDFLTANGWVEDIPLVVTDTGLQMSYSRGEELLAFYIKEVDMGIMVEVIHQ